MDELVLDMQDKMNKSIDSLKQQLTSLRTETDDIWLIGVIEP